MYFSLSRVNSVSCLCRTDPGQEYIPDYHRVAFGYFSHAPLVNSLNQYWFGYRSVGQQNAGSGKYRTLIKFDLSAIPAGATVVKAQLKLKYYDAVNGSAAWVDRTVQAHQLLVDWNQFEATRDERQTGVAWAAPYAALDGRDAKATPEDAVTLKQDYPRWVSWDLTALTNQWLDGSAPNYGVILWATNEDTPGYELRFRSSLASVDLPVLEVVYTRPTKTVYFLKDHLGSIRATVDELGQVVGYDDYDPWGYILPGRSLATGTSTVAGAAKNKFTGKEWDDELGLKWYYFGARYYDPEVGRFLGVDPLSDAYSGWSPFVYSLNNPVIFFDLDGRSTVTDSAGNVIYVNTTDNDLSVYRVTTVTGGVDKFGIEGGPMSVKEKVGETEYIDEFVDPETDKPSGRIMFGESWDGTIEALHEEAMDMDLADMANASRPGKQFDLKANVDLAPYGAMTGKLLNAKYASARSAGNFLAGYNARHGTYLGFHVSWTTFMKMAGAVHQGKWSEINAIKIIVFGTAYGPPPWYGEIPYAGRMIQAGWNKK